MIDIKELIPNVQAMKDNVSARNVKADVDAVVGLYRISLEQKKALETYQAAANETARRIKSEADAERKAELIQQGKQLREKIAEEKKVSEQSGDRKSVV